jgi:hypothetical protein
VFFSAFSNESASVGSCFGTDLECLGGLVWPTWCSFLATLAKVLFSCPDLKVFGWVLCDFGNLLGGQFWISVVGADPEILNGFGVASFVVSFKGVVVVVEGGEV